MATPTDRSAFPAYSGEPTLNHPINPTIEPIALGVGLLVSSKSRIVGAFAAALLSVGSIAAPARARRQTAGQPPGLRRLGMDRFASMLANSDAKSDRHQQF
jgi:hypothetical protein